MKYTNLGATGLRVSVVGLGTADNTITEETVKVALDHGINFFDTAPFYGSEKFLGDYLPRAALVATKTQFKLGYRCGWRTLVERTLKALEQSLRNLKRDHIDLYQFHRATPATYQKAFAVLREPLAREYEKGKIRAFGITENNESNTGHAMCDTVCASDFWDVVMAYAGEPLPANLMKFIKASGKGSIAMCCRATGGTYAARLAEGYDVVLTRTRSAAHLIENIKGAL